MRKRSILFSGILCFVQKDSVMAAGGFPKLLSDQS